MLSKFYSAAALAALFTLCAPVHASFQSTDPLEGFDEEATETSELFSLRSEADSWWSRSSYKSRHKGWSSSWKQSKRERRLEKRAAWQARWQERFEMSEESNEANNDFHRECIQWWSAWHNEKNLKDDDLKGGNGGSGEGPIGGGKGSSEVPLPAGVLLFGSALGLMAGARSRRSA